MKIPAGTTQAQWDRYNDELCEHEAYCAKIKPKREDFETEDGFSAAMGEWFKVRFMDAPNEPGYYRANND